MLILYDIVDKFWAHVSCTTSITVVAEDGLVERKRDTWLNEMASWYVSVPKLFALGDAAKWFKIFEICSRANEWDEATKAV